MSTANKSSEKSFGLLFGLVFLIISIWPLFFIGDLRLWSLIISIIFFSISFIKPNILRPLNIIWIKFGEVLGVVIAPIVMAFVYFFILTPISIIVRIFGKDLLNLKFFKKQKTYWIKRKKEILTMNKQF